MNEIKIDDEIITFQFTVAITNAILNILGQAPFVASAGLIHEMQKQASKQVDQLIANKQNESKTTLE